MTLKQSHFCVKRSVLIGMQPIKEYKPIVNGLIKAISDKTSFELHLTRIHKKMFLTITLLQTCETM